MLWVFLQPLLELAKDAVHDIMVNEAIITNERVKTKRFILWEFKSCKF
jgi:hypothetical protein